MSAETPRPMRRVIILFVLISISFYLLAGILFNPLIIWTVLPLYIAYILFDTAFETSRKPKLFAAVGYVSVSVGLSYIYHVAWFLDWKQMASSDPQSALIFIFFPVYAAVLGLVGYGAGWLFWVLKSRQRATGG